MPLHISFADELDDGREILFKTNPLIPDTDEDGQTDGQIITLRISLVNIDANDDSTMGGGDL